MILSNFHTQVLKRRNCGKLKGLLPRTTHVCVTLALSLIGNEVKAIQSGLATNSIYIEVNSYTRSKFLSHVTNVWGAH